MYEDILDYDRDLMGQWDDDDRAYNASVEMEDNGEWYPEWKGPEPDFLPEFNAEDIPF